MKIYSTNRINALGLSGPEKLGQEIKKFIEYPINQILVDNDNIEESEDILYKNSKQIFERNERQIFIGGDHSITYPILKAFTEKHRNPFLIIFDAHADCDFYTKEPSHEEWLRAIIEQGFPKQNIILIGTRKMWKAEENFLAKNKIKIFRNLADIEQTVNYIVEKTKNTDIYISIDIDAIDPQFAPAVNYPEPDGIHPDNFLHILKKILTTKLVNTIDITEGIPDKDTPKNHTMKLITRIIENIQNEK